MSKLIVEAMIEGGKASAAPPLGPALGPTGLNVAQVIIEINKKTESFKGMQVPIKIIVETDAKTFEIEIGTPPTSSLIKKEAGIEKGSSMPHADKVADLRIEQIIKVAKMKSGSLSGKTLKEKVKCIIGTCNSMGVLVGGKAAVDAIQDVNSGKYDSEIKAEKTELTADDIKTLAEEKKKLAENVARRHAEEEKKANDIMAALAGKEKSVIKSRLKENGISESLITKLLATIVGTGGPVGAAKTDEKKKDEKKQSA
jgi:large subunit ribosomal protein L11